MRPPGEALSLEEQGTLRHELRTPLNHLLGYGEMLLESLAEEGLTGLQEGLESVQASGRQLLALVNQQLPASQAVRRSDLPDLARMLHERLPPLRSAIEGLEERARPSAPDWFANDLARLRTAADNLRQLAEHLGAPASPAAAPAPAVAQAPAPEQRAPTAWGKVLVVDDDASNRDLLCRRLQREGYAVAEAENGRRALELLAAGSHDLVLLDVMMPEVDGYQVLAQVKASPELRDVPVIMISALDEIRSVVRCIELGAEDYLPKPFDPVLLRARVGTCLEKKRLRELELDYLRGVAELAKAAGAVESGSFAPESLTGVAARPDELGRLARVFQSMAREVRAREERLRNEVRQLSIEINQARKEHQVAEIVGSEYFQRLQEKANLLKQRVRGERPPAKNS